MIFGVVVLEPDFDALCVAFFLKSVDMTSTLSGLREFKPSSSSVSDKIESSFSLKSDPFVLTTAAKVYTGSALVIGASCSSANFSLSCSRRS
jgi:hypothetical protein